jgi:hypothetical protein
MPRRCTALTRVAVLLGVAVVTAAVPSGVLAGVVKVEIASRTPYANGREFPGVGAYETLRGKVRFAVDPQSPANRAIIDLELAPRNAAGLVEFSADLEILAPVDRGRGNGALLYDVNNRGNKLALGQFNSGADEFLMRRGYTVVWSGWIAETAPGAGRLRLNAPVALEDGRPLTGLVRSEVVVDAAAPSANLGQWANQGSYAPTAKGEANATLTWRLREADPRIAIPRGQWRFETRWPEADGERGQLPLISLEVAGGLRPGYIYEVIYEAQGSVVQGTGMAGIRDLVSYLKNERSAANPLAVATAEPRSSIRYAYGFGVSQSGRCLRTFLYDGFNADEQGRKVFDGVIPHVAGAGLGFFNHRFASPTRHNAQHDNHLYPADLFPFTYGDERDPFTGRDDGILRRSREAGVVPKVLHTQSSSEYWHRSGSLVHTDPRGQRDAEIPPEVRVYAFGGTQHGPGNNSPAASPGNGQLIGNPADYRPLVRALLDALDDWVRTGREPPASVYPRIADGSAAPWPAAASGWKPLPGVRYPEVIQQPEWLDRGSDFATLRRSTVEPPVSRGKYGVRVPAYDGDNRERGTLDLPCVAVPVGTHTSWNLRNPSIGADTELLSLAGGYIPLPKTAADRERSGDPRLSLAERYASREAYVAAYLEHAKKLIANRYLLAEELPALEVAARRAAEEIAAP